MVRFFYNTKGGWEHLIEQVFKLHQDGRFKFVPSVEGKFPDQRLVLTLNKGVVEIPEKSDEDAKWKVSVGHPVNRYVTISIPYEMFKHASVAAPDLLDNPVKLSVCVVNKDKKNNLLVKFVGEEVEFDEVEDIKLRRHVLVMNEVDMSLGVVYVKNRETRFYNTRDAAESAMIDLIGRAVTEAAGNMVRMFGEGLPKKVTLSKRDNEYIVELPDGSTKVFSVVPADIEDK